MQEIQDIIWLSMTWALWFDKITNFMISYLRHMKNKDMKKHWNILHNPSSGIVVYSPNKSFLLAKFSQVLVAWHCKAACQYLPERPPLTLYWVSVQKTGKDWIFDILNTNASVDTIIQMTSTLERPLLSKYIFFGNFKFNQWSWLVPAKSTSSLSLAFDLSSKWFPTILNSIF